MAPAPFGFSLFGAFYYFDMRTMSLLNDFKNQCLTQHSPSRAVVEDDGGNTMRHIRSAVELPATVGEEIILEDAPGIAAAGSIVLVGGLALATVSAFFPALLPAEAEVATELVPALAAAF